MMDLTALGDAIELVKEALGRLNDAVCSAETQMAEDKAASFYSDLDLFEDALEGFRREIEKGE